MSRQPVPGCPNIPGHQSPSNSILAMHCVDSGYGDQPCRILQQSVNKGRAEGLLLLLEKLHCLLRPRKLDVTHLSFNGEV